MKKIIGLLAAVCIFSSTSSFAQDMTYGVKGGLNFATFGGDASDSNTESLVGINIGGFADFPITEKFSIQPELLFSQQGATQRSVIPFFGIEVNIEVNLTYLNLPIMAKYKLTDEISVLAGPQIGLLMAAEVQGEDIIENYNKLDFGLNIGGVYELPIGVFFEARYNLGFAELVKSSSVVDNEGNPSSDNVANRVLTVGLGYRF